MEPRKGHITPSKRREMDKIKNDYIEESIRIWLSNKDSEVTLRDFRVRRPRFWNEFSRELSRRGLLRK